MSFSGKLETASLSRLNALSAADAASLFLRACGSTRWADRMVGARPFDAMEQVFAAAERAAESLDAADWREAFAGHPRIGETRASGPVQAATSAMSQREQAGMAGASEAVREEFSRGNAEYERRFGHVFLICATGRSAGEMLEQLRARLRNTPDAEFANAVSEQRKITRLRLARLLYPDPS